MKIKLFLDEDVHAGLAHALRQRGYDVVHGQELELKGRSDTQQLLAASRRRRCLFSFNVKDFVILHNAYVQTGKHHWGIIVSKQLPFTETMSRIMKFLQNTDDERMRSHLEFL